MNNTRMFSKINIIPSISYHWFHLATSNLPWQNLQLEPFNLSAIKQRNGRSIPSASYSQVALQAASSMWLATHDDMADPNSEDPVARQSTRVAGAIGGGGKQLWTPFSLKNALSKPSNTACSLNPS